MFASLATRLTELSNEPAGLAVAFLVGLGSAVTSLCCSLPVLGVLVGYSGLAPTEGSPTGQRRRALVVAASFAVGTLVALVLLGLVAGWAGAVVRTAVGSAWTGLVGMLAIVLGLVTLRLLPLPATTALSSTNFARRISSPVVAGVLMGGTVATASLCCNPGILVVAGAAFLQGDALRAALLMGFFALGFSLPLSAALLGLSAGSSRLASLGGGEFVRTAAGLVLVVSGFALILSL